MTDDETTNGTTVFMCPDCSPTQYLGDMVDAEAHIEENPGHMYRAAGVVGRE